ncbi:MAG TPA: histidine ammonia-lyase, partial [Bdellovibrionota bacterium]|nr:histidine ammonia-lyase [Bdellovibrionota bacterium]
VRPEVVDLMVEMLNRDIVPVVPCQGSVGASGDLAPLAHMALAMIGEGTVEWNGERVPSKKAFADASLKPLTPAAKEGLALLNGTQMMTAMGGLALLRGENALRHVDVAAAMTLEAVLGTPKAYDERVHKLRPHPGQTDAAYNLRLLTAGSEISTSHRDCDRVQDAYSVRCAPQVHGAGRDALTYVRSVLEREMNSVTDNPILFPGEKDPIASAGNFHGQPVAVALDTMALALTGVASISERRIFRLLDPKLSELPAGLTSDAGLKSGLMMAQVTAASLVSECKTLSHPASVDSIPTWADQEDHVSMGAFAARKAEQIVDAFEKVIAIELICAAQGLEYRKPLRPSKGVEAAVKALRTVVPSVTEDRQLTPDFEVAVGLIRSRTLLEAVQDVVGELK